MRIIQIVTLYQTMIVLRQVYYEITTKQMES